MTLLKRITLGLAAILTIIAVVGAVMINRLDLNHHKAQIEKLVLDKTGRELQINGQINASIFPWVGLSLHDVTLANSAEFASSVFATVASSEIQLELLPLVLGQVNVQTVELAGLSLRLQRDADGKTNWDDLMSTTGVVETDLGDDVIQEVEAGAPVVAALSIGKLQVSNANVIFTDALAGSYFSLSKLNLNTGSIVLSQPFDFESDFVVINGAADGATNGVLNAMASAVTATGAINLNLADNVYQVEQLQLTTVNTGAGLPVDQLPISITGNLIADLNEQTIDLTIAEGVALGVPISGEFHAMGLQDTPRLTGLLKSGDFDAASVVEQLGLSPNQDFDSSLLELASVSARFEQKDDLLLIDGVDVSVGDIKVAGDFQVTNLSTAGVLVGELESNEFNITPWLREFGWLAPSDLARRPAKFSTSVRQSGQLLSFNQLALQLDESQLTGVVEITDSKAANSPIKFALAIDEINLDDYLSSSNEVGDEITDEITDENATDNASLENENVASAVGDNEILPVQLLRKLNLEGEVTAGLLTVAGLTTQNVVIPILAKEGRIEIKEAKAELYSGSFFSTTSLDVQSDEPLLTIAANLNGLNAEPFIQDFLDADSPLTGIANINLDLLSRGNTSQQLLERVNGAMSSRFTDGKVIGIDIAAELRRASRLLAGLSSSDASQSVSTEFSELSASAVVADGVLQSDDLVFTSSLLSMSGQGGVNLADHSVDYLLHILLSDSALVQQDAELGELSGIELSVPVRGHFSELSIDFKTLLINAFDTNLLEQLKDRKTQWLSQQKAEVADKIESEKAALQARLEKEREDAAVLMTEKKQQAQDALEEQKIEFEKRIETEKEELKNKLESNLKKGLNDLLGEN